MVIIGIVRYNYDIERNDFILNIGLVTVFET